MAKYRYGKKTAISSLISPLILYFSASIFVFFVLKPYLSDINRNLILAFIIFASWRYSWQLNNYVRSFIYGLYVYPKIKKKSLEICDDEKIPKTIYFIIPSYQEEDWVTEKTFQSIIDNLSNLPCSAILFVSTASDHEDALITKIIQSSSIKEKTTLVLQRQSHGKRFAMGHALRCLSRHYDGCEKSITIFMDGDSCLEAGALEKSLPFFSADPSLGALTTNEVAYMNHKNQWFKEWFNLKFGQRHVLFQSHALSNKVLTLTGRFSLFRTSIVENESFINIIENDMLTNWIHGRFRFLMGDDKSSWYYVLKNKWKMIYLPDVTCYSLESREASFRELSISLPYRWFGNTLRNNGRALKLGPKITGSFIWCALLDQRFSMWTSLVGIVSSLLLSISVSWVYLPIYISTSIMVRSIYLMVIALQGHPVSIRMIPLMLYNQWLGSIIKILALFNLSDQNWSKGSSSQTSVSYHPYQHTRLYKILPKYMMCMSLIGFTLLLAIGHGIIKTPSLQPIKNNSPKYIKLENYGVYPNDNIDDAKIVNKILSQYKDKKNGLILQFPPGITDLYTPIYINTNNITLLGDAQKRSILFSHIDTINPSSIIIEPNKVDISKASIMHLTLKSNSMQKQQQANSNQRTHSSLFHEIKAKHSTHVTLIDIGLSTTKHHSESTYSQKECYYPNKLKNVLNTGKFHQHSQKNHDKLFFITGSSKKLINPCKDHYSYIVKKPIKGNAKLQGQKLAKK